MIVGHTRSRRMIGRLKQLGWGRCMVDRRLDPWPHEPWMLDNGVYAQAAAQARTLGFASVDALLAGGRASELEYDYDTWYEQVLSAGELGWDRQPEIVVLPDRVGDGERSLATSVEWYHRFWEDFRMNAEDAVTDGVEYDEEDDPLSETWFYLAVQPGIEPGHLERPCPVCGWFDGLPTWMHFRGILLGGSSTWKVTHAARWKRWCEARGLALHYARAGTPAKARFAREVGADSLDSAFPLWTVQRFERFADEIRNGAPQMELFGGAATSLPPAEVPPAPGGESPARARDVTLPPLFLPPPDHLMTDPRSYRTGDVQCPAPDDPAHPDAASATAAALDLSRREPERFVGVWAPDGEGSALLAIAYDGHLYRG